MENTLQADHTTHAALDAVKEQAGTVGTDVRELGTLVQEAVQAEMARFREQGGQLVSTAKERCDDVEASVSQAVRSHPVRSLAWAAGAGLVLGMVARR